MPIAKETLRIGFVVVANPGTYVTKQAVKDNGWQKLVDDGPDIGGTAKSDDDSVKSTSK
jgi:hypothetical protein